MEAAAATVAPLPPSSASEPKLLSPPSLLNVADSEPVDPQRQLRASITQTLIDLGSTLLTDFADPATDYDPFEPKRRRTVPRTDAEDASSDKPLDAAVVSAVSKLNKAAIRSFGSVGDFLQYDYSEELGPLRKKCILTITRPDDSNSKRIYSTKPDFARKSEAKTKAASIAIDNGALEFILYGENGKAKGIRLAPVNAPSHSVDDDEEDVAMKEGDEDKEKAVNVSEDPAETAGPSAAVAAIEQCCVEWRAGRIQPVYYPTLDTKGTEHGCALKITLSPALSRTYSVLPTFKDPTSAKEAAASLAISHSSQPILEFIKHGDGQTFPLPLSAEYDLPPLLSSSPADENENEKQKARGKKRKRDKIDLDLLGRTVQTLSDFWDRLPKPLPEPGVGIRSADEMNPIAWLNGIVQRTGSGGGRGKAGGNGKGGGGGGFKVDWCWTADPKLGLHGCVMRIEHTSSPSNPTPTRTPDGDTSHSYLVPPVFLKRQDARIAACLQAISEGVGDWIRSLLPPSASFPSNDPSGGEGKEVEMTDELRERAKGIVLPGIERGLARLNKNTQGKEKERMARAEWGNSSHRHLFGSTLTITLPPPASSSTSAPKLDPASTSTPVSASPSSASSSTAAPSNPAPSSPPSIPASQPKKYTYSVPPSHKSRFDAKLAVCLLAESQGLLELIRFGEGVEPPEGYDRDGWDAKVREEEKVNARNANGHGRNGSTGSGGVPTLGRGGGIVGARGGMGPAARGRGRGGPSNGFGHQARQSYPGPMPSGYPSQAAAYGAPSYSGPGPSFGAQPGQLPPRDPYHAQGWPAHPSHASSSAPYANADYYRQPPPPPSPYPPPPAVDERAWYGQGYAPPPSSGTGYPPPPPDHRYESYDGRPQHHAYAYGRPPPSGSPYSQPPPPSYAHPQAPNEYDYSPEPTHRGYAYPDPRQGYPPAPVPAYSTGPPPPPQAYPQYGQASYPPPPPHFSHPSQYPTPSPATMSYPSTPTYTSTSASTPVHRPPPPQSSAPALGPAPGPGASANGQPMIPPTRTAAEIARDREQRQKTNTGEERKFVTRSEAAALAQGPHPSGDQDEAGLREMVQASRKRAFSGSNPGGPGSGRERGGGGGFGGAGGGRGGHVAKRPRTNSNAQGNTTPELPY